MEQAKQLGQQETAQQNEMGGGFGNVFQMQASNAASQPPPGDHAGPATGSFAPPVLNLTASPIQAQKAPAQQEGKVEGVVQRKLVVDPNSFVPMEPGEQGPPLPLTIAAQNIINEMCPEGNFNVDTAGGAVTAAKDLLQWPGVPYRGDLTYADLTSTPESCKRMMAVLNDDNTTTVDFRPGGPSAGPGSRAGAGPGHDGVETDAQVHIDPRFQGQYRINGQWVDVPFYLLFAHELFGHALPKMQGTHAHRGPTPAGGTPPQEAHAVAEERVIAREHGQPERPDDYSGAARQRPN